MVELPWGADVERFAEVAEARFAQPLSPQPSARSPQNVVFMGSFRAWHGVTDFVRAALLLLAQGRDLRLTLIGDGPERPAAEALAAPYADRFTFTGAVPYAQIPALLAKADIGVAPFTTAPHPALRAAGFFWSPLKIYEYMAAGLPVVTAAIPPLDEIIRDGQEGALFPEGDLPALAAAIAHLLDAPAAAQQMGRAARARVVARYSWQRHCEELERILLGLITHRVVQPQD
jgi:glycosyltransferase involved in cell wall biosynthesis